MKKIILILVLALTMGGAFAQTCELSLILDPSNPNPQPGDDFLVGVWVTGLDYPGSPNGSTIKSAQLMLEYDDAIISPIKTSGPPPVQKWYWNVSQMLTDYDAKPACNVPNPGDLRAVFYTMTAPGIDPQWYGGIPVRLWDYKFHYNSCGDLNIQWGTTKKLVAQPGSDIGGKLEKAYTMVTAWDNAVYTLTALNGLNVTCPGGSHDYVWNGSVNGEFSNPNNWTPNGVPGDDPNDTATIPAGTPNTPASAVGNYVFKDLTIDAGAAFALSANSIHLTGNLTVNGSMAMGFNSLGGPGSLVVDGTIGGAGIFAYGYYIAPAEHADGAYQWHAVSSPIPVSTTSVDVLTGLNGIMNDFYLNYWDETAGSYVHVDNGSVCDISVFDFNPGVAGFLAFDDNWPADSCNVVNGGPNTGAITIGADNQGIKFGGAAATVNNADVTTPMTASGPALWNGWNLIGNPFPASLDMTALAFDATVSNTVKLWDGTNYVDASVGLSSVLPAGQGFFAYTTAGANFHFDLAARTTATAAITKVSNNVLKLRASNEDYEDLTYVIMEKNATANFDLKYDSYKKFTFVDNVPQMYTIAEDGSKLSLNSVSTLEETMPLNFRALNGSGMFTIEAVETGSYSTVILEDTFTGITTNLLTDSYTFNYNSTDDDARFVLHFAPLSVEENAFNGVNVYSIDNTILVNISAANASEIVIYDMLGQEITRTVANLGKNTVTVDDDNYYLVSVIFDNNIVNAKVFVK
jgi:hypothetical protein